MHRAGLKPHAFVSATGLSLLLTIIIVRPSPFIILLANSDFV